MHTPVILLVSSNSHLLPVFFPGIAHRPPRGGCCSGRLPTSSGGLSYLLKALQATLCDSAFEHIEYGG